MVTAFHHSGLVVRDLERMTRFYTEDIGLKILSEIDSIAPPDGDHTGVPGARRKLVFVGIEHDHQIELVHYVHPPAGSGHFDKHQLGATHICFKVEDLRQTYSKLKVKGVSFVTEPKFRQMKDTTVGVVYARDPEGNWLEFIQGL